MLLQFTARLQNQQLGTDEVRRAQMAMKPTAGPVMKDTGKYLTVWKHQADGSWKIIRDIDNSDLPVGK
jgi:ketosteroid isomerase-like protein